MKQQNKKLRTHIAHAWMAFGVWGSDSDSLEQLLHARAVQYVATTCMGKLNPISGQKTHVNWSSLYLLSL